MTPSPITPGDSLAAVVAELRATPMNWLHEKADRIERLDAEMREDIRTQAYLAVTRGEVIEHLRAKLAACERQE